MITNKHLNEIFNEIIPHEEIPPSVSILKARDHVFFIYLKWKTKESTKYAGYRI